VARGLDGEIGYLRLGRMSDEAVDLIRESMEGFREAMGLIVDVRGNGGGSRYALAGTFVEVRLSRMASFMPNGRLFDGHGVEPDVEVRLEPTDVTGQTDAALTRALEVLGVD